jgi:hypothetical protein
MTIKRIIPCLDVLNGKVVKGIRFKGMKDLGDPVEIAKAYVEAGADELVFLDINATVEGRDILIDLVRKTAEQVSIPFGGRCGRSFQGLSWSFSSVFLGLFAFRHVYISLYSKEIASYFFKLSGIICTKIEGVSLCIYDEKRSPVRLQFPVVFCVIRPALRPPASWLSRGSCLSPFPRLLCRPQCSGGPCRP